MVENSQIEVHLPFDLMEILKPQLGDRSRLDDDQGAFLDAFTHGARKFVAVL